MKRCRKCHQEKPFDAFPRRRERSVDGYRATCRVCSEAIPKRSPESRKRERAAIAARRGASYKPMDKFKADVRDAAEARAAARAAKRRARAEQEALEAVERLKEWERARRRRPSTVARRKLQEAVAKGRIVKPTNCTDCGKETSARRLHGHHEDYSKPLEVRWLCSSCHVKAHGGTFVTRRGVRGRRTLS